MASLTKVPLRELEVDDLGGGLNEGASPNKVPIKECISGENFRVSSDGKSKMKRPGLVKFDSIYDFGSKKVLGVYGVEETDEVKTLVFLEDEIKIKSGNEWKTIFSPTTKATRPVSVVQDKGVVIVAGYEKPISIIGEQAFYSGIEAPVTPPTVTTKAAGADHKATEYPESNQDHCGELGATAAQTLLSQSFKVADNYELTKIKLDLKKIGSPTGNLWVEIHSSKSGTSLSKNTSINIVGEGTEDLDVNTLNSSFAEYELEFTGENPVVEKDKIYYLVIYRSFAVSASAYVEVGFDCSSPTYDDGKYWEINGSLSWGTYESIDLVFEVHGKIPDTKSLISIGSKEGAGFFRLRESAQHYLLAQEFSLHENSTIEKVKIPLKRVGIPEGYIWAEIHSSRDGTSENKEESTNIVGQASDGIWYYDIQTYFDWVEFTFSGTKPSLTKDAIYYLVLYCDYIIDPNNYIGWTYNNSYWLTDSSIGFVAATKKITDSNNGLAVFSTGDIIEVIGSAYNDGTYNVVTGGLPGEIVVSQSLTDESPALSITIRKILYSWIIDDGMNWYPFFDECFSFELIGTGDGELKATEYSFDNLDDVQDLRESSDTTLMAQEFKVYEDSDVTKVKLYLSKFGSVTGNLWAEIHSAQVGTKTTKDQSDNIVGEASANVNISGLTSFPTYGWITFTFSGVKPDLKANTVYYLVIYGDFSVDDSDHIKVGHDKINASYSVGQRWDIDDDLTWTLRENIDLIFEVWLAVSDLVGDYSFVITYKRGGNYECESNPSGPSQTVNITAGKIFELSEIPVSSDPQVTHKGIYRTQANGAIYYWEATIPNSQTTYDAADPDSALGDEVSYENYPPPPGKTLELWDGCFWVGDIDDYREGSFKSRQGFLEQFPGIAASYYPLREDEAGRLMKLKEFNNYLYGIKDNSIWVMSKTGDQYLIDKTVDGIGTKSPDTVIECNIRGKRCLVFLSSQFKIEVFDGYNIISDKIIEGVQVSDMVKKTLSSINKPYAHLSTADNYLDEHEYRLAIPTGSSTVPNKTIVFNYMTGNFFVDVYHQNISFIKMAKESLATRAIFYGTDQGQLYKVESEAMTDDGMSIVCKFRTGWIGSDKWLSVRQMFLDFILEQNKTFIFKIYSNLRESPDLDLTLSGSTPSGALPEIRNIIHRKIKSFVDGSFFSFEFICAETVPWFEINKLWLYIKQEPSRRTIKAS
jgi:hypothetical protein